MESLPSPDSSPAAVAKLSGDMRVLMLELEKMSKQQLRLMESMNTFQTFTRNEVTQLKNKLVGLEELVESLRRKDTQSISTEGEGGDFHGSSHSSAGPRRRT